MVDYYVLYQAVVNLIKSEFMMITTPGARWIEEKIIPGWGEGEPIYVRWHHREGAGIRLHLLTYLHKELTAQEVEDLLDKALSFIQDR